MAGLHKDPEEWFHIEDPEELYEVPLNLAEDPYFLINAPTHPEEHDTEEDPLEDEEEDDPKEEEEMDDEDIPHEAQKTDVDDPTEDEEDRAEEEPAPPTPPVSPPRQHYRPYRLCSKALRFNLEKDPIQHLMSQADWMKDKVGSLESLIIDFGSTSLSHQVEVLEEGKKEDSDVIQNFYHHSSADRTTVNAMSTQAVVAARELYYILDQFEDYVLYMMTHFGKRMPRRKEPRVRPPPTPGTNSRGLPDITQTTEGTPDPVESPKHNKYQYNFPNGSHYDAKYDCTRDCYILGDI
ncbi:unnamed protein product [Lactuca saligna]|uniref:Uncharacterized protein n=1 Tax=Lactuca saligna TaxID=75948 RepID=A0AA35UX60_LACSI|nr:unnamed protein product [Lactuca saligna]